MPTLKRVDYYSTKSRNVKLIYFFQARDYNICNAVQWHHMERTKVTASLPIITKIIQVILPCFSFRSSRRSCCGSCCLFFCNSLRFRCSSRRCCFFFRFSSSFHHSSRCSCFLLHFFSSLKCSLSSLCVRSSQHNFCIYFSRIILIYNLCLSRFYEFNQIQVQIIFCCGIVRAGYSSFLGGISLCHKHLFYLESYCVIGELVGV
mmetsp:Transcript_36696/g.53753  ORF Transcript_36696/g.53753 Transcript_36696/m.53753 type:complete len:204 (-) Transcript_36696:2462-3073(-)